MQDRANGRNESIRTVSRFIRYFLQIAVLGVGAWLTLNNEMTAGGMIAGSILAGRAMLPVDRSISAWRAAVGARNAYRRLRGLLAGVEDPDQGMSLPTPRGHVAAEAITYVHPGRDAPTLNRIGFSLEPGECLGIIGPTGAGKSTLAQALVGIVRPQGGKVRLDGMELANWSQSDRAKYVGFLPQDVGLFPGTVRANIARLAGAEPEQVLAAAERAGAHELIARLPKSYETELGEAGSGLSAGQQQRIGLARALFGEPRLIVLDEPNANLDQEGEAALMETLGRLKEDGITTVVVAHRPNVLRHADKVLVLSGGAVQMFAPRDEVFKKLFAPRRKITDRVQMVQSDA